MERAKVGNGESSLICPTWIGNATLQTWRKKKKSQFRLTFSKMKRELALLFKKTHTHTRMELHSERWMDQWQGDRSRNWRNIDCWLDVWALTLVGDIILVWNCKALHPYPLMIQELHKTMPQEYHLSSRLVPGNQMVLSYWSIFD